jgi:hypothetical protein
VQPPTISGRASVTTCTGRRYKLGAPVVAAPSAMTYQTFSEETVVRVLSPSTSWQSNAVRARLQVLSLRELGVEALVRPQTLLREPHVGMVLPALADGVAIADFRATAPGADYQKRSRGSSWGLRQRLRVCAALATAFEQIGRAGLCYATPSPDGLRVVHDDDVIVRILDLENFVEPGTPYREMLGAEWIVPPELLEGRCADELASRYALGTAIGLLLGMRSDGGKPGRTRTPQDSLRELFVGAIADTIEDRWRRPAPLEWLRAIHNAVDQTVRCNECKGTSYLLTTRGPTFACALCGATNSRPVELGFYRTDCIPEIFDLSERRHAVRHLGIHRFIVDREQRFVPTRLAGGDDEARGALAQFGTDRNRAGDLIFGLKNLGHEEWTARYPDGREAHIAPGRKLTLFDATIVGFPSGVQAKVLNPHQRVSGRNG